MNKKLNENLVWVAAALAVGLSFVLLKAHITRSPKTFAGIVGFVFIALGGASTFLTEAKVSKAVLAFALAGLAWGALVYVELSPLMKLGGAAKVFGLTWTALWTLDAVVCGIGACIAGRRFQGQLAGALSSRRAG